MLSRAKVQVRPTKAITYIALRPTNSSKAKDQGGSKIKQDQRSSKTKSQARPTMVKQLSSKTINGQERPKMVEKGQKWLRKARNGQARPTKKKVSWPLNVPPWVSKWPSDGSLPGFWFNHFQNHVLLTKVNPRTSVYNGSQKGSCLCKHIFTKYPIKYYPF